MANSELRIAKNEIPRLLSDFARFCEIASGLRLRSYQQEAAQAILNAVLKRQGRTFVVLFPRQSGKNELQAQLEAFLLLALSRTDAEIVKVSPTWKPQSLNAMRRLERVLERNLMTAGRWKKEQGYIYRLGRARISFLSGGAESNIVGATASTLLECDEAQDVSPLKWDKEINPMAASANATRVFWGTAWTAHTLLAREKAAALEAERSDGVRRLFQVDARRVGQEVPAYEQFVLGEIARHGRSHPLVRSQFFSEEIDGQAGMFPAARLALMQGTHPACISPLAAGGNPTGIYAFLIDVAGEDESSVPAGQIALWGGFQRDATALTIVQVDLETLSDPLIAAPRYRVLQRKLWNGARHTRLYAEIIALAELWQPQRIVVDATGVGAGLASFLRQAFQSQVIPFLFTGKSKSELGWKFLSIIESGRFKDYSLQNSQNFAGNNPKFFDEDQSQNPQDFEIDLQKLFFRQAQFCEMEILPGPARSMRWGVPDGRRDPLSGEPLHDDLLISAALCAVLDEQKWGATESVLIPPLDPLASLKP